MRVWVTLPMAVILGGAVSDPVQGDLVEFTVSLDGMQALACMGSGSPATGSGTFTLDTESGVVSFLIEYSGLQSPEFAAHVHGPAPPCEIALIVFGLPVGSPMTGSAPLTPAQQTELAAGLYYVVVHTEGVLGGEIRGQILPLVDDSPFVRSDCNADGSSDIGDAIFELGFLFSATGGPILCPDACDANDDGVIDIGDPIHILDRLFSSGPLPPSPFPLCGGDPSPDSLACVHAGPCP